MKTKRDYIRDAWQVYCKIYNIPHDEADVYTLGGHWYGQTRRIISPNGYDTEITSEWLITFKLVDNETAEFAAKCLKKYQGYELQKHQNPDKG